MNRYIRRIITYISVLILPLANGVCSMPEFHGSLSQTYIKTSANEFPLKNSDEGTFEFTELLFNYSQEVSDTVSLSAQFIRTAEFPRVPILAA